LDGGWRKNERERDRDRDRETETETEREREKERECGRRREESVMHRFSGVIRLI